jgi:hypothetical protein
MDAQNIFYQTFTVDYIAITFDEYHGLKFARQIGYKGWATDVEGIKPRGYSHCRELETGALIAWHTDRKDMGVHVQLSGETLRYYSTIGVDWKQLLTWAKKHKGRTSRVDLALDLHNSGLQFDQFSKKNLKPYKGKGRTPRFLPVGTQEDGWTVYVGSRTSEKFLRVYDWSAKHDKEAGDYLRIELECKGEIAHAIGWEFPEKDTTECVEMAQTLIRNVADFTMENWQISLASRNVELSIPQGKDRDTFTWLVKICAPSLAKTIAKNPTKDVIGEFWNALRVELRERGLDVPELKQ